MKKISYAIPVCNEFNEIQRLLGFLLEHKNKGDEIIILYDTENGTKEVEDFLDSYIKEGFDWFKLEKFQFKGHFADMKNKLTSCEVENLSLIILKFFFLILENSLKAQCSLFISK